MAEKNHEVTEKKARKYDREVIKENWEKWDFISNASFVGKFLDETQTLTGAGIKDKDGVHGDIILLGFLEPISDEKYGIIKSGVLGTVDFVKNGLYEITYKGVGKSKKTGHKVNLFDVYKLTERK